MNKALILVDLQNDFMPKGALAVPKGDEVIAIANRLVAYFNIVVATQDWHPANHRSFAVNHVNRRPGEIIDLQGLSQILWPAHCVQHTNGAAFHQDLQTRQVSKVISKGMHPEIDSYSAFFDNARRQQTDLDTYLRQQKVSAVYLMGLATEYCVKYSALDACSLGYETYVFMDGCRGLEIAIGDSEVAMQEMQEAGVKIVTSEDFLHFSPSS